MKPTIVSSVGPNNNSQRQYRPLHVSEGLFIATHITLWVHSLPHPFLEAYLSKYLVSEGIIYCIVIPRFLHTDSGYIGIHSQGLAHTTTWHSYIHT